MFAPSVARIARAADSDPAPEDRPVPDAPPRRRDGHADAWDVWDAWEPYVSDEERRWQLRMRREMGPLAETLRRLRERDLLD